MNSGGERYLSALNRCDDLNSHKLARIALSVLVQAPNYENSIEPAATRPQREGPGAENACGSSC
jgi:hypothetical protein